jgi:hypothetical protein
MKGPHVVVQYKDVNLSPQDSTLFMHPNDCKGSLPQPPANMPQALPKTKTPAKPEADKSQK